MKIKALISQLLIPWFLTLTLIAGLMPASANETVESRSFVVESVDGSNATLTKGTRKEFQLRQGTRLAAGNTVTTGKSTKANIKLDDDSSITMASSTKIDVSKLNRRELMATIVSGSISVNAKDMPADSTTTFKAGNATMGIRGTMFTVNYTINGIRIVMLEGTLEVETPDGTYTLEAGHILEYPGIDGETLYTEIPLTLDVVTGIYILDIRLIPDSFTLEFIKEHAELLISIGTITQEDANLLDDLIEQRIAEEEEQAEEIQTAYQTLLELISALEQSVMFLGVGNVGPGTGDTDTSGDGTGDTDGGTTPPTEPTDPVDPTDPLDPTDPVDPTDPEDPEEPEDPEDPPEPDDPGGGGGGTTPPPSQEYTITLSQTEPYTFPTQPVGYDAPTLIITVTNEGTQPTGELLVSFGYNYAALDIPIPSIAVGANANFTIFPSHGLDAGTYNDTITVFSDTNSINASFNVSFIVTNNPSAPVITFSTHPQDATFTEGNISGSLSVVATASPTVGLTYEWHINTTNSNMGGTIVTGATAATFTIPSSLAVGDHYFYCLVSATGAASARSNVAVVTVNSAGSGTIIQVADDDDLMNAINDADGDPVTIEMTDDISSSSDLWHIPENVTLIIPDDMTFTIEGNIEFYNDGTINVQNGGTLLINQGNELINYNEINIWGTMTNSGVLELAIIYGKINVYGRMDLFYYLWNSGTITIFNGGWINMQANLMNEGTLVNNGVIFMRDFVEISNGSLSEVVVISGNGSIDIGASGNPRISDQNISTLNVIGEQNSNLSLENCTVGNTGFFNSDGITPITGVNVTNNFTWNPGPPGHWRAT